MTIGNAYRLAVHLGGPAEPLWSGVSTPVTAGLRRAASAIGVQPCPHHHACPFWQNSTRQRLQPAALHEASMDEGMLTQ